MVLQRRQYFLALALFSLAGGCSHPRTTVNTAPEAASSSGAGADAAVSEQQLPDRQIVRNARMSMQVTKLEQARARIDQLAASLSAQIAQSTIGRKEASYVIRVPANNLDAYMDSVGALGKVRARSATASDVTNQMVDTEARLATLRGTRDRLRQLLDRAATVQDVISVERELARVQADLESLERRLAMLRSQVAMSELALSVHQRPVLGPIGIVVAGTANLVGKLFVLD